MDEPQQRDADRLTPDIPNGSDLPIYAFALVAAIVIVAGLFAWIRIDPVVPTIPPARESSPMPQ